MRELGKNMVVILVGFILLIGFSNLISAECIGATANFTCGATITESCTLNESLYCNSTNALTIGANNVYLDGSEFSFIGDGTNIGFSLVAFSANNFTINNLSITNFSYGMNLGNNENFTINNSQIFDNTNSGIVIAYVQNSIIENSLIQNNTYYGISFGGGNSPTYVYNNRFIDSGTFTVSSSSSGIYFYDNNISGTSNIGFYLVSTDMTGTSYFYDNFINNSNFIYCSGTTTPTQIYNNTQYGGNFFNCGDGNNVEVMNNSFYGNMFAYLGLNENISIHDNYVDDQSTAGNSVTLTAHVKKNLSISDNYFFNISADAITSSNTPCDVNLPCIIEGNTFNVSNFNFIDLVGSNATTNSNNFVIRNNLFIDNNINDDINDLSAIKFYYVSNSTIYNNTIIRGHDQGIWTWGMENSEIYDNNVTDCDCMPYQTERSNYNNSWHDNYAENVSQAIIGLWFDCHDNTYENFTGVNVKNCIQLLGRSVYNNTFKNITCSASNSTDSTTFGILFGRLTDDWGGIGSPDNNIVSNINLYNFYDGITSLDGGETNLVYDSIVENVTNKDIRVYNSAITDPNISITLLNVSFNKSNIEITKGNMTVKWYVDVYVNDTSGNATAGAEVKAYDGADVLTFTATTNASGYITRQNLTEYYQNATESYYYTNYTINAVKIGYRVSSKQVNLTTNHITDDGTNEFFTLETAGCVGAIYTFICNQTINESCTMNGTLSSNGTCFTIGADNLIIDGAGNSIIGNGTGIAFTGNPANNITINNFIIDHFEYGTQVLNGNTYNVINNSISNCSYGLWQIYATKYLVENNTFRNNPISVYMGGFTSNSIIRGNRFYDGGAGNYEIYIGTQNTTFENNYMEDNAYWGILIADDSGDTVSNTTVRNNIFNNSNAIYDTGTETWSYNNTFYTLPLFNCVQCRNGRLYNNTGYHSQFAGLFYMFNYSIDNNRIYGQNVSTQGITIQGANYQNITIGNNYFENYSGNFINTQNAVCLGECNIEYNIFNITDTQQAIYFTGTNSTLMTRNFTVRFNTFYDHDISRVIGDSADIGVWTGQGFKFYNNTHYRGYDQGIWTWEMNTSEIYNEKFYDLEGMPYQTERRNYNNYWHDNYAENFSQGCVGLWFSDANNRYENFECYNSSIDCVQLLGKEQTNNTFTNFTCTFNVNSAQTTQGILFNYLVDDEATAGYPINNLFQNFNIDGAGYCIEVIDGSDNNLIRDSICSNIINESVYLHNSLLSDGINISITLLNVSFNKSNIEITNGNITVKWYLDVYVNDTNGTAINGSNVSVWDINNVLAFNVLTNSSGYIERQNVTEYMQNSTDTIYYTNYTINATKEGYDNQTQSVNITGNKLDSDNVVLTLSVPIVISESSVLAHHHHDSEDETNTTGNTTEAINTTQNIIKDEIPSVIKEQPTDTAENTPTAQNNITQPIHQEIPGKVPENPVSFWLIVIGTIAATAIISLVLFLIFNSSKKI